MQRYNTADEDNFTQCGIFFREVLKQDEKERLVDNIASHLCNAQQFLQVSTRGQFSGWFFNELKLIKQERALHNFGMADKKFGAMLKERLSHYNSPKNAVNGHTAHM